MKDLIKRIIGEQIDIEDIDKTEIEDNNEIDVLNEEEYREGKLILERDNYYDPAIFSIFYEEEGNPTILVTELNQDFFTEQMATTVFDYILTR